SVCPWKSGGSEPVHKFHKRCKFYYAGALPVKVRFLYFRNSAVQLSTVVSGCLLRGPARSRETSCHPATRRSPVRTRRHERFFPTDHLVPHSAEAKLSLRASATRRA